MMYLLPSHSTRKYRGKYPSHIHTVSMGSLDIDGKKCAHIELNDGSRYTASYDVLDLDAVNAAKSMCGVCVSEILKLGATATPMAREAYDEWLAGIQAKRDELTAAAAVPVRRDNVEYHAGREARRAGKPFADCPYVGEQRRARWELGWREEQTEHALGVATDRPVVDLRVSWQSLLGVLIVILEEGSPDGKAMAKAELRRMAIAADRYNGVA